MSENDSASILRRRSFLLGAASVLTGCVANEAVDSLHSGGAAGWGGASGAAGNAGNAGNAGAAGSTGWGGGAGQGGSAGAAGSAGAGGAAGEAGADGGAAGAAGDAGGTHFPGVTAIPRIDAHVHIGRNDNTGLNNYLVVREKVLTETGADVALWIDLDSGKLQSWTTDPAGLSRLEQHGEGRMIPTYADFYPARGLALSAADIGPKHNLGYIGYKMHFGSHNKQVPTYPYINDAYFAPVLAAMQAAGMPLASIHLEGNWYESGGSVKQREAIVQVAKSYPSLRIVIAHFGHHNAAGLGWFRDAMTACPNLHVDLSASIQHFYKFDHEGLRDLMILHADRFLYGTDNIDLETGADGKVKKYAAQFEYYETSNMVEAKLVGKTLDGAPTLLKGLALPQETLEKIYCLNALRVYPELVSKMKSLGYALPV